MRVLNHADPLARGLVPEPAGNSTQAQNLHRNVIGPAAFFRGLYQRLRDVVDVFSRRDLQYLIVMQKTPEAVGAENQHVAGFKESWLYRRIRGDAGARSQGGGEDVPLRMGFGLLGADDAVVDQTGDVGVVMSQARDGDA